MDKQAVTQRFPIVCHGPVPFRRGIEVTARADIPCPLLIEGTQLFDGCENQLRAVAHPSLPKLDYFLRNVFRFRITKGNRKGRAGVIESR